MLFLRFFLPKTILLAVLALSLQGCVSRLPIGVDSTVRNLDLQNHSLLLLTLDITRSDSKNFLPVPQNMVVELIDAQGGLKSIFVPVDNDGILFPDDVNPVYAFRLKVPVGSVQIKSVIGRSGAFPIRGRFSLPIRVRAEAKAGEIVYLGRVSAVLRPRMDHEYRAGELIPLVDQAVTGLSTGTFDIELRDMSEEDLRIMQETYPAIRGVPIKKELAKVPDRFILDRQWRGEDSEKVSP